MPSLRTILLVGGLVVLAALVITLGWQKRAVIAARWNAAFAQDDAVARGEEVKAAATVAATGQTIYIRDRGAEQLYLAAIKAAQERPDANDPDPVDPNGRLRAFDDGLCEQSPRLGGCPVPGGGDTGPR